jgi:hypothetical protein
VTAPYSGQTRALRTVVCTREDLVEMRVAAEAIPNLRRLAPSSSGIGISTGIPGLRVEAGPVNGGPMWTRLRQGGLY